MSGVMEAGMEKGRSAQRKEEVVVRLLRGRAARPACEGDGPAAGGDLAWRERFWPLGVRV